MITTLTPKTTIYEKPNLLIEYDETNKMLIQNWTGFSTSKQFREGVEKSVEVSKKVNPLRLLTNARQGSVVKQEDTYWATTYGFGNMLQHGLKAVAIVIPTDEYGKMALANIKKQSGEVPLAIQYFEWEETALSWLKSRK